MDTRTGEIRQLAENEKLKRTEVPLTQQGFRRLVTKEKEERLTILKNAYKRAISEEKRKLGRKLTAAEMKELHIKTALEL